MNQLNELINGFLERIQAVANSEDGIYGMPSGFKDFDRATGGFENADLIVIGARPGEGKSAFLLSLIMNICKGKGIPSALFSLDMSDTQVVSRIIAYQSGIESVKLKSGYLSPEEWEKFVGATKALESMPLYILDETLTVDDLCEKAEALVKEQGVKIVFIDCLQLLSTKQSKENRYQEIAYATRKLKELAKRLNVPVIVTSQLNRNPESRTGLDIYEKAPRMHELRDSGTICEDANLVLLLYRPERHFKAYNGEDANGNDIRGLLEVHIAKNNNGREDIIKLKFKPEVGRVENWETDRAEYCTGIQSENIVLDERNCESPF